MERIDVQNFRAERAWGSRILMNLDEYTVRLHWTNQPYRWHANTGEELFVVLDGQVRMHLREKTGREFSEFLKPGDAMHFSAGDEHYAEPLPEARVLVIERKDSE